MRGAAINSNYPTPTIQMYTARSALNRRMHLYYRNDGLMDPSSYRRGCMGIRTTRRVYDSLLEEKHEETNRLREEYKKKSDLHSKFNFNRETRLNGFIVSRFYAMKHHG